MKKMILCCGLCVYVLGSSLCSNIVGLVVQKTTSLNERNEFLNSSKSVSTSNSNDKNVYEDDDLNLEKLSGLSASDSFSYVKYDCRKQVVFKNQISVNKNSSIKMTGSVGSGQSVSSFSSTNANSANRFRDNRIDVPFSNMNKYQASSISIFESKNYNNQNCVSSSFLIWNGMVITSAHSVLSNKIFNTNMEVGFVPNDINNRLSVSQIYQVKNAYIPLEFYNSGCYSGSMNEVEKDNDWALLELDVDNVQNIFGSLTMGTNYTLGDVCYHSIGFSYDSNYKMQSSFVEYCRSFDSKKYTLYSYLTSGMSGGPVIAHYFDSETLEDYDVCVGINSFNVSSNGSLIYSGANMTSNNLIF